MPTLVLAIDARRARQGATEFERATGQVSRSSAGAEAAIKRLGLALAGAFSAREVIRTIAGFEETLATVRGVTGATEAEFRKLTATARELGATTRFSAQQAGEGLLFLARAGFSTEESISALRGTLALAQAGSIELGQAADFASNIVSAFGFSAGETARVVDVLVATSNRANTSVSQAAEALKLAAPVAREFGLSLEEATAAIGKLGDSGIQGSEAGTQLRGALLSLIDPADTGEAALAKLGLTIDDVNPVALGFTTAMENLKRGLDSVSDTDAAQALSAIFGARRITGAAIFADATEGIRELTEANRQSAGEAQALADIMDNTLRGSLLSLKSAVEEAFLSLGDAGFAGALRTVVVTTTDAVRVIAGMDNSLTGAEGPARALAAAMTGLAAAGGALVAINVAGFAAGIAAQFIAITPPVLTATGAVYGFNLALTATPVGLAVAGIGALTAGYFLLTTSVETAVERYERLTITTGELTDATSEFATAQEQLAAAIRAGTIAEQQQAYTRLIREIEETIDQLRKLETEGQRRIEIGELVNLTGFSADEIRGQIEDSLVAELEAAYDAGRGVTTKFAQDIARIIGEAPRATAREELEFIRSGAIVQGEDPNIEKLRRGLEQLVNDTGSARGALEALFNRIPAERAGTNQAVDVLAARAGELGEKLLTLADAQDETGRSSKGLTDSTTDETEANEALLDALQARADAYADLRGQTADVLREERRLIDQLAGVSDAQIRAREALEEGVGSAFAAGGSPAALAALASLQAALERIAALRADLDQSAAQARADASLASLREETELLRLAADEREVELAVRRAAAQAVDLNAASLAVYLQAVRDEVVEQQRLRAGLEEEEAARREAARAAEEQARSVEQLAAAQEQARGAAADLLAQIRLETTALSQTNDERQRAAILARLHADAAGLEAAEIEALAEQTGAAIDRLQDAQRARGTAEAITGPLVQGLRAAIFQAESLREALGNIALNLGQSLLDNLALQPIQEQLTAGLTGVLGNGGDQAGAALAASSATAATTLQGGGVAAGAALVSSAAQAAAILGGAQSLGSLAGGFVQGGTAAGPSILPNALGNLFSSRIIPFANGGLAGTFGDIGSTPATFPMAGGAVGLMREAGPEAIVPAKRDGGGYSIAALVGGRETRVSLTRTRDGRLGVDLGGVDARFAAGGVLDVGLPMGLRPGLGGGAGAAGGGPVTITMRTSTPDATGFRKGRRTIEAEMVQAGRGLR